MRSTRLPSSIERLLGFAPQTVPPHVFSLWEEGLAYGRFAHGPEGFELEEHRVAELPPDLFQEGLLGGALHEPKVFGQALGELLERLGEPPPAASLVLPDTWVRVAFASIGALPRGHEARDEMLRWKLRRLVPFRVDELRIGAVEVAPLPNQPSEEPNRLLLVFALEALLEQLEDIFEAAGVRLGQVASASLSLLAAAGGAGDGLSGLVLVEQEGYTSVFARGGEPVLHRYKGAVGAVAAAARAGFVQRDLKLTRNFLDEHFPGEPLRHVLVAAPPESRDLWLEWTARGLGEGVEPLAAHHLPLRPGAAAAEPPWWELAPLLGAAVREVA